MSDQFKQPYTRYIMADIANGSLTRAKVESMQEDFRAHPTADREYIDSLDEALAILLTPEQLVERQRDREGLPPAPDSEVK